MKVWVLQQIAYTDTVEKDTINLFTTRDKAIEHFLNTYDGENLTDDQKTEFRTDGFLSYGDCDGDMGVEVIEMEVE